MAAPARGADLSAPAASAYEEYVTKAARDFVERATHAPGGAANGREAGLRDGRPWVEPGSGDGILSTPGSLVHHWRGGIFLAGVTLDQVVGVSQAYSDYPQIFHPVKAASVLARTPDGFEVQFRMRQSAGGLTATLDVRTRVRYVRVDPDRAYVVSRSEEIREVKNAGQADERQLPEGHDSGYLWRAATFTGFAAAPGGVFMSMETVGLSRPFPVLLGWLIEPIARRVGRHSVEDSMKEFQQAVAARSKLAP